MGEAIGQVLPLAIGVVLSPVPIIAVVLMLTTPRAKTNASAFVLGWLLGLAIVGTIVLLVAGPANANENGQPATWVSWLKIVLGVLLLLVAVREFRGRPKEGEEAPLPKWMETIDRFGSGKALGAGAVLAGVNPKNFLLSVGAAAAISQTGISAGQQAIAYAVFAVISTVGVAAPVVIYLAMGEKAASILDVLKTWMAKNNAVIMAVLALVIGVKHIGDGIAGLS